MQPAPFQPHPPPASPAKLLGHAARGKYGGLLLSLLVMILLAPIFQDYRVGVHVVDLLGGLVLLAALWAVGRTVTHLAIALVLLIPAAVINGPLLPSPSTALTTAGHALILLFLAFVIVTVLADILTERRVTADTLLGAAATYLLLSLAWAVAFSLIEVLRPGSLHGPDHLQPAKLTWHGGGFGYVVYFSLATLTTLGYGDFTPVNPLTGTLAALESATGQVYLAILVARLVGMHIVGLTEPLHHHHEHEPPPPPKP